MDMVKQILRAYMRELCIKDFILFMEKDYMLYMCIKMLKCFILLWKRVVCVIKRVRINCLNK